MAKNRTNSSIVGGVADLAANAKRNIEARNTHDTHDTHNAQRKQKHPRINMAFYGDNLAYVQEAAYQNRMSVTEYVNQLIVDDKNRKLSAKKESSEQLNIDDIE